MRMKHGMPVAVVLAATVCAGGARAGESVLPDALSCTRTMAPEEAGVVATPGGFMLVHPRNADLSDDYVVCKTLWFREGLLQRMASTAPIQHECLSLKLSDMEEVIAISP